MLAVPIAGPSWDNAVNQRSATLAVISEMYLFTPGIAPEDASLVGIENPARHLPSLPGILSWAPTGVKPIRLLS